MTELLTAAQMRAIEQVAIESGEVTGLELMERAGQGVVAAVFEEWPELASGSHTAVVLCGPGNNGGDGFVVARLLKDAGWRVEVFLYGGAETLPPDARTNYDRWSALGETRPYFDTGPDAFWLSPQHYGPETVLFDAVFGTGLSRPVRDLNAFGWATQTAAPEAHQPAETPQYIGARVVAIDLPSGLCSDSGRVLRDPEATDPHHEDIRADLTVTFHRAKLGHHLAEGPDMCGTLRIVDIGL